MEAQTPGDEMDATAAASAAAPSAMMTMSPPVDAKLVEVQETLESMLSKKSLVRDQFLAGNMNPQMYIPIMTLMQHAALQAISATEAVVVAAAIRSTKLGVDEQQTMIRPLLKSKRNVVILREVSEGTTEAEITDLFAGAPHQDKIASIKPEVNNTWFVKFNKLDDVQDVVLWLRQQQLKGQPVNASIKSEHFLRSFFPVGQAPMPPMLFPPSIVDPRAMEFVGAPMPPPPPPLPQEGMQGPGFWQPWGRRYQPAPLVFTSQTTLSPSSMPDISDLAVPMGPDYADPEEEQPQFGGKGGKGQSYKGGGGGSWGSSSWKGGGSDWKGGGSDWKGGGGGGDWKGGGEAPGKGKWKGSGKDWAASGGGKGVDNAKGQDWYAGGSKDWYASSKDFGGKEGNAGGKDWYSISSGKARAPQWVDADKGAEGRRRKGGKGSEGGAEKGFGEGCKQQRVPGKGGPQHSQQQSQPQPQQPQKGTYVPVSQAAAREKPKTYSMGHTYKQDFRKYTKEDFERIRQVVNTEPLARPETLVADLGPDLTSILREVPVLEAVPP